MIAGLRPAAFTLGYFPMNGWDGWIRTNALPVQSRMPYRLATSQ